MTSFSIGWKLITFGDADAASAELKGQVIEAKKASELPSAPRVLGGLVTALGGRSWCAYTGTTSKKAVYELCLHADIRPLF